MACSLYSQCQASKCKFFTEFITSKFYIVCMFHDCKSYHEDEMSDQISSAGGQSHTSAKIGVF